MQVFVTINKDGMRTSVEVNVKELIDKGTCDKGFIWNPSNCECECDKSCDFGECLDYKNYKCRNKLVDKLVEECSENIDGNKMVHNEHLNVIQLNDYDYDYDYLHNIHSITCCIFHNNHMH